MSTNTPNRVAGHAIESTTNETGTWQSQLERPCAAIEQAAADLRDEDYQLAYAIDILKGLAALGPEYAAALARQAN